MTAVWRTSRFQLDLERPLVMGIVNATPDSFSENGRHHASASAALHHCERLLKEGADILDIGGESTRPAALLCHCKKSWPGCCPWSGRQCSLVFHCP